MDYPLCRKFNFALFLNRCLYCLERLVFWRELQQILYFFLSAFCIKRIVNKISNFFNSIHGLTPLQKCQFCGFLKPMLSLLRTACLLYKTSKIVFWRFIFAIYDVGIQGVTRGYCGFQGITRGYKGLQGVTMGYRGLQGVTRGDSGWQGVTKDYRNFFLTRTFPDTFSWSIFHKNQS